MWTSLSTVLYVCYSFGLENHYHMLSCGRGNGDSRQFNFVDVTVKRAHYSLRYGTCLGMSDWNFEASVDGVSWHILHEARQDRHLLEPSEEETGSLPVGDDVNYVSMAEKRHRHTWSGNTCSRAPLTPLFFLSAVYVLFVTTL